MSRKRCVRAHLSCRELGLSHVAISHVGKHQLDALAALLAFCLAARWRPLCLAVVVWVIVLDERHHGRQRHKAPCFARCFDRFLHPPACCCAPTTIPPTHTKSRRNKILTLYSVMTPTSTHTHVNTHTFQDTNTHTYPLIRSLAHI